MARCGASRRRGRSRAATPKWWSMARPIGMYITTTGIGRLIPGREHLARGRASGRQDPALRPHRRSRHHHSAGARRTGSGSGSALRHAFGACRWWRRWPQQPAPAIRWMRDPTRGGVATSLNELARDCGLGIVLSEERVPVRDAVRGACELAGPGSAAHRQRRAVSGRGRRRSMREAALEALRATPGGAEAAHDRRDSASSRPARCW